MQEEPRTYEMKLTEYHNMKDNNEQQLLELVNSDNEVIVYSEQGDRYHVNIERSFKLIPIDDD